MPSRGVIRRERKNHSNLRPKHKHTKPYLRHYWPYLPMVTLLLVGLWLIGPASLRSSPRAVLAQATNVSSDGLLKATNKHRATANKRPLALNSRLSSAAQAKAQDMVNRDYWSHTAPDGSTPWTFIINSGYQYQKAGENLAYGFMNNDEILAGWMNSPSHQANVLDNDYQEVGFGMANSNNFNKTGPSTVIVAMYGRSTNELPLIAVVESDTTSTTAPYSTSQSPHSIPESKSVSKVSAWFGNKLPWVSSAISFVIGAALAIFAVKHGLAVKRTVRQGEKFIVTHPLFDVLLVAIIILGLFLTRDVGTIL